MPNSSNATTANSAALAFPAELLKRAAKVRLAVFDVDGIFTDGRLYFAPDGSETKVFHVRDGWGIKALQRAGIEVAIISGRSGPAVSQRMQTLGVQHVFQGFDDKLPVYTKLLAELDLTPDQTSYMGDDIPDIPILQVCGLAITVADGHGEVQPHAHYITPQGGGNAAVRQACELLLAARAQES